MLCRVKAREWFEQAIAFMFPVLYFYVQSDSSDQTIIDQKKKIHKTMDNIFVAPYPFCDSRNKIKCLKLLYICT